MAGEARKSFMEQCKAILHNQLEISDFQFCGETFIGLDGVFHTKKSGHGMFAENLPLETKSDARFLEIGCGSGCVSVIHYLRNKENLSYILATDINERALENTKENFERFNVPGQLRCSDVFNQISDDETFDTIFWNVPFFHVPPDTPGLSLLDLSIIDPGYKATSRFISGVQQHLRPGGKAIIGFSSTCGYLDMLENIAKQENQRIEIIWKEESDSEVGVISFELLQLISI